ncbi:DUF3852 domain-containing protein [Chakrabartyella piscis]|uniref:DUF3852 domain-containing protein n=1 Tax=Chakrabartyella piscis TaxID=2918914 RepID=UPI00295899F6|nr:DUF3852 domain-containing protein [Chakrabartyella piscis]
MTKKKRMMLYFGVAVLAVILIFLFANEVYAADVSGAIEETWKAAALEIKEVTNQVIFPVVDMILVIVLFVKLAVSYFDYKKHGEFDFMPLAILFFGLMFALTAPLYIWQILE